MQGPGGSSSSQPATDSWWEDTIPTHRCQHRVEGFSSTHCHITTKERRGLLPGPSAVTSGVRIVTLFTGFSTCPKPGVPRTPQNCILPRQSGYLPAVSFPSLVTCAHSLHALTQPGYTEKVSPWLQPGTGGPRQTGVATLRPSL